MKFNVVFILIILTIQTVFAQHETDERVIGFKYKLKFNNKQPQIKVQNQNFFDPFNPNYIGIMKTMYANSICDTFGNLLFYYDGFTVYDNTKNPMVDGKINQYNFNPYYCSSLIVPIEESNRRYYYLFETIPHQENWDFVKNTPIDCPSNSYCFNFQDICKLQYHIIDMLGNGGKGEIIKKNIFVTDSVAPSISGVKHHNNIDTWVSVLKSRTSSILNFKVNSCSISSPVKNSIPDFEYTDNPYLSYMPKYGLGFQLVYSINGDMVSFSGTKKSANTASSKAYTLYVVPFDDETGLFDFNVLQTIVVESGICANLFSHDSKYLYYHNSSLFVPVWCYQYDLQTQTSIPFYYNLEKNRCYGFDYGKQNEILIYKWKVISNGNKFYYEDYLGAITNINQQFITPHLIDNLLASYDQHQDVPSLGYIARNNYIYNFYHPDYKKPPAFALPTAVVGPINSPACFKNEVLFAAHSSGIPADSAHWLVQQKESSIKQRFLADTFALHLTPGTYTAQYVAYKYCVDNGTEQSFVLEDNPQVQLSADSLYTCESKSIDLPVPQTTSMYQWHNMYGESVALTENKPGIYVVEAKNSCGTAKDSLYIKNNVLNIANLVTANNDHKNDCWLIESSNESETIEVSIYNSWGSAVFSDKQYKNNWCPADESDGMYYYDITYNNACTKKGWLQVIH